MGATVQTYLRSRVGQAVAARRLAASPLATGAAMVLADTLAVLLAGSLAVQLWGFLNRDLVTEPHLRLWPATGVFLAAYAILGLYPGVGLSPVEELRRLAMGTTIVYLVGAASLVLTRDRDFSRGVLLGGWALGVVLVPVFRAALRSFCAHRHWWGVPVVVLGAGVAGRRVVSNLRRQPGLGLKPVAFLDDDEAPASTQEGVPVAGPLWLAEDLGRELRIHHALVAMPSLRREQLLTLLERLGSVYSHVIVLPDLFGMASLWVTARDLGGVLGLEVRQNLLSPVNRCLKRALDIVVAALAGIIAAPVVAAAAAWIKMASPGPAFFDQERGGEGGRRIRVWKLRTMFPDAEAILERHLREDPSARAEWGRYFKLRNDPRLLPGIGRLLRRTSLDELPQLWNVIRGEMSLVGPRPFPHYHLSQFSPDFGALRSRVLPGITGLWQVSARSDGDLNVQQALDSYYIRNWSLWLDLYLLARTVRAVLLQQGAY